MKKNRHIHNKWCRRCLAHEPETRQLQFNVVSLTLVSSLIFQQFHSEMIFLLFEGNEAGTRHSETHQWFVIWCIRQRGGGGGGGQDNKQEVVLAVPSFF